jgi:hypothetical protein
MFAYYFTSATFETFFDGVIKYEEKLVLTLCTVATLLAAV